MLLVHTFGEKVLYTGILGEGDMRANIKHEPTIIAKRGRVPSVVGVLVVQDGCNALLVQPISGTESGHSSSKYEDIGIVHNLSPCILDSATTSWTSSEKTLAPKIDRSILGAKVFSLEVQEVVAESRMHGERLCTIPISSYLELEWPDSVPLIG